MRPILFLDMDGVIAYLDDYKNRQHWDDPLFWECLPKTYWADDLVRTGIAYCHTYILTTPYGSASIIGKHDWILRWYPELATRVIYTDHKHLFAGHGRVLVDDDHDACKMFRSFGGIAFEVSNPIRFPHQQSSIPPSNVIHLIRSISAAFETKES